MANIQKDAFLQYEGDNYFKRNKDVRYEAEKDPVVNVLQSYDVKLKNVLEIGSSIGHRLNTVVQMYPGVKVTGVEPSQEAILKGKDLYPGVKFIRGTADDMPECQTGSYDLVVIGFVLYVVDREMLLKVVAET